MTRSHEVYVALLDEGTDVWRPVTAEPITPETFRLLGSTPDGEQWQFQPGDVVRCERRCFSDGAEALVAVSKVPR